MCMRARDRSPSEDDQKQFRQLYKDMTTYYSKDLQTKNETKIQTICRKIKRYCQLTVRAQRRDNDLFDYFCQNKSLDLLYNLFLKTQRKQIMLCVIQSMSMMLVSLSQPNSIHYFLSSSCLLNLLQIRFPGIEVQVAEYYINMLKSIAAKLDDSTIHIFYNEKIPTFPLLWQAIRFHNHPEALIRNTSRNIVLSIFKLSEPRVKEYLASFPFVIYYSHLVSELKTIWTAIDKIRGKESEAEREELPLLMDEHVDLLMYIEDLASVCNQRTRKHLLTCLLGQGIVPLIRDFSQPKLKLNKRTVLFILSVILKNTKIPEIVDLITIILFGKYIQKDLSLAMLYLQAKDSLISYNKEWAFPHFWDNHYDVIARNCRNLFNIQGRPRSQSDQCDSPRRGVSMSYSTAQLSVSLFGMERIPSQIERQINKIQDLFDIRISNNSRSALVPRHKTSTNLFALLAGMHKDLTQSSFINLDELDDNKNTNGILGCLESEDQSTVYLCVNMINKLISNKAASKQILKFSGMYDSGQPNDIYSNENLRKIVNQLLEVFNNKSGRFQIVTYMAIQNLIRAIIKDNQSKLIAGYPKTIIMDALKTLVDRFETYVSNIKDYVELLNIHSQAKAKLGKQTNRDKIRVTMLTAEQENHGVTSLSQQIKSDFAVYFLSVKIKTKYFPGKYTYQQLTEINATGLSSILGKEIQFPQDSVTTGQFKQKDKNQSFKCFILINKAGFMLSERLSSNKGRVYVNCDLTHLTCQQRATDIKKLYFTYSEMNEKDRSFYVNFGDLKMASSMKAIFDQYKQETSKEIIDKLIDCFELSLEDQEHSSIEMSKLMSKEQISEKQTSPGLTERVLQQKLSQSLIDMWPF